MKRILLTGVFCLIGMATTFAQCAMCRATVGSNLSEGRGVIGTGLNFGILYLLVMPYLLVGTLIYLYFRVGKKELAKQMQLKERLKNIYS